MKTASLKPIVADKNLIAYCGLYCGACRSYLKGSCPGCQEQCKSNLVQDQAMLPGRKIRQLCGLHCYKTRRL